VILDVLYGRFVALVGGNGAADSNRNKFVVNNAAVDVAIDLASAPAWYFIFCQGPLHRYYWFRPNDNLLLLSGGVIYPYNYSPSIEPPSVFYEYYALHVIGAIAASGPIAQITGAGGDLEFPSSNYELSTNIFIPWPAAALIGPPPGVAVDKLLLRGRITGGRVSMIASPAALDTSTQVPIPFVKVLHTLPMVA
jgi:hypothetical protein